MIANDSVCCSCALHERAGNTIRCPTYDFLLHYTQIVVSVRECAHFRGDL
jgi:hypothetical protein